MKLRRRTVQRLISGIGALVINAVLSLASAIPGYAQGTPANKVEPHGQAAVEQLSAEQLTALIEEAKKLQAGGRNGEATKILERLLEFAETALGPDHLDTSIILNILAHLYSKQFLYGKAETFYKRVLNARENAMGQDHLDTATSLNNLASLYSRQARYRDAEIFSKRALNIRERKLGSSHPDTAFSLESLARIYYAQGLYSQAEPLVKRSLSIREAVLGPVHPDTALSLSNLATLYSSQGLHGQAEPLHQRALEIFEKTLGPDHLDTAKSLIPLAFLYIRQGLHSQAEPLLKRTLNISEKTLGPDHPETATALNNLAFLYSDQGFYGQAEPLYQSSLAIFETVLGPDHPHTAATLNNLAGSYRIRGLHGKAEELYQRALSIREKTLGPGHPDTATSLSNLAAQHLQQGKYGRATFYLKRGLSTQVDWLNREALFQPRIQRQALIRTLDRAWEVSYSIANRTTEGLALALTTRLLRHGLLLEIEQAQSSLSRAPGPTQDLAQRLSGLNKQISDIQLPREQRAVLRQQRDALEQQLFRQWPDLKISGITVEQAAAALPTDGVLVEFQRYQHWVGGTDPTRHWGLVKYLALILKPDGTILAVRLGEAEAIEQAIAKALKASAEGYDDAQDLWGDVSDLVIKPLDTELAESRQLFLSPDGELHRVPFAALPGPDGSGELLSRAVQLRLLTTGRDLVRFQKPARKGHSPLVIANPNFGRSQSRSTTLVTTAQTQQRSADLSGARWDPLLATAQEGKQIASLLGTEAITGNAATVSLLEGSPSPLVLHIASHGFFVGDQDIAPEDHLMASLAGGGQVARFQGEDPLLRSGIVLAGANNPGLDPNDDGLLTALEAAALQLEGTELVVLSACSTGSGDLPSGDGLYGLQRALTVAGARSTLLSLWKVDDAATAEFMVRFYRRLKAGEGRADALAAVQAEFRGGEVKGPSGEGWSSPYYWAAWQLVGDWRPIEGL